jgi:hypothetical protein
MAFETVIGKDWPDITAEINRRRARFWRNNNKC